MKTKNQMSFKVYIILVFFINLLCGVVFFRFIYNQKLLEFGGWFSLIYFISMLIGVGVNYGNHRTVHSSVLVVCVPYGIYCMFAYHGTGTIITSVLFVIGLVLVAIDIFIKSIPKKADKEYIMMIRYKKLIRRTHNLIGFFSIVIICIVLVSTVNTVDYSCSNTVSKRPTSIGFSLENWENADVNQKEEYIQLLLNYESDKLYIKPLTVSTKKMPKVKLAYYSDSKSMVVLNKNHLKNDSLLSVCNSIAHESFHAAQYNLIINENRYSGKAEIDEEIKKILTDYKNELADYKSYNSSDTEINYKEFLAYYSQKIEKNAREYGDSESIILYKLILSSG